MKKSGIKNISTEELIVHLAWACTKKRSSKGTIKTAQWICEELKSRGVVADGFGMFQSWLQIYEL